MMNQNPIPIHDEMKMRKFMDALAKSLDEILNGVDAVENPELRQTGFVLLLHPMKDESGRCNYVTNGASREHVVKMFKRQIERFEEDEVRFEGHA